MYEYRYRDLIITLNNGTVLSVSYYTSCYTIYDVIKEIIKDGFIKIKDKYYPIHNVYSIEEE